MRVLQALNPASASPGKRSLKHHNKHRQQQRDGNENGNEACDHGVGRDVVCLETNTDFATFLSESPDALSTCTRFSSTSSSRCGANASTSSRSPPPERRFPKTPNTSYLLEIPQSTVIASPSASLSPIFFDLQVGDNDENALVVPLTPFEVVRRLRFVGGEDADVNEVRRLSCDTVPPPLPQSSTQIIPVSAASSRFYTEARDAMKELSSFSVQQGPGNTRVDDNSKWNNQRGFKISRGVLAELEGKVDGVRSLRELGFDMSCLGEEGDELLSAPWTAFEMECKGEK